MLDGCVAKKRKNEGQEKVKQYVLFTFLIRKVGHMRIPIIPSDGNFRIALCIFGIAMIAIGGYILVNKDAFGKGKNGKMIVEALKISESARKIVSVIIGLLIIMVGLFVVVNVYIIVKSE